MSREHKRDPHRERVRQRLRLLPLLLPPPSRCVAPREQRRRLLW